MLSITTRTALLLALLVPRVAAAQAPQLTLGQALTLGLRRAPELHYARALASAANARVSEQESAYYPTVHASATGTASAARDMQALGDPERTASAVTSYSAAAGVSADLRWTLYNFGRTSAAVAAALESAAAAAASVTDNDRRFRAELASAYIAAHYKERLQGVAQETLSQRERLAEIAKGLVQAGLQPPVETIRASARVEGARLQLVAAETEARDAYAQLAGLLSLTPEQPLRLVEPQLPGGLPSAESAAMDAGERLPSVSSAAAQTRASRENVNAAWAEYLPSISLTVDPNYTLTRSDLADPLLHARGVVGQLIVTVPVFDLALGARVKAAASERAATEALEQLARRNARTEALRAVRVLRGAQLSVVSAQRAADAAKNVLAVVQARYLQGLADPVELIDAVSSDEEARVQRTQSELDRALAHVRMLNATAQPITEVTP